MAHPSTNASNAASSPRSKNSRSQPSHQSYSTSPAPFSAIMSRLQAWQRAVVVRWACGAVTPPSITCAMPSASITSASPLSSKVPAHAGQRSISIEWTLTWTMSLAHAGHFIAAILPRALGPPCAPGRRVGAEIAAAGAGAQRFEGVAAHVLVGVGELCDQRGDGERGILVDEQDRRAPALGH